MLKWTVNDMSPHTNGSDVINLINLIEVIENSEEWTKHDAEQLKRI